MSKSTNGAIVNPIKLSMLERINAFEKRDSNRFPPKLLVSKNKVVLVDRKEEASTRIEELNREGEVSSKENIEFRDENCRNGHFSTNNPKRQYDGSYNGASDSDSDADRAKKMEEAARIAEELMNSQLRKINIESDLRTIETRYPTRVNSPRYYTGKKEVMDKANKLLNNSYSFPFLWENKFKWFNCVESVLTTCNDDEIVHNQPQYDDKRSSNQVKKSSFPTCAPSSGNREKRSANLNSSLNFSSEFDSRLVTPDSESGIVKSRSRLFSGGGDRSGTKSGLGLGAKGESEVVGGLSTCCVKEKRTPFKKSDAGLNSSGNGFNVSGNRVFNAASKLNGATKVSSLLVENSVDEKGATTAAKKSQQTRKANATGTSRCAGSTACKVEEGRKGKVNATGSASYQDDVYCFDDGAGYVTFGIGGSIAEKKDPICVKKALGKSSSENRGAPSKLTTPVSPPLSSSDKKVLEKNAANAGKCKGLAENTGGTRECKKSRNVNGVPARFSDSKVKDSFSRFEKASGRAAADESDDDKDKTENIVIGGGGSLFSSVLGTKKCHGSGGSGCDKPGLASSSPNPSNADKTGRKKAPVGGKGGATSVGHGRNSSFSPSSAPTSASEQAAVSINYSSNFIRGRMDYFSTDVFV
ncbi:hypothetical protein FG386_002727 [Cryptosporidium ryanae]|uniref:uncharacterized protein n=1 Tax=Cryptosporidium ryanae TaxID=515981 RepID=UPI00351A8E59|nr:hypothetical protein FG386_002727 [Cryptosporidium ryanae]